MPVNYCEKAKQGKRPLGVLIFGGFNFFVLGIASFIFFLTLSHNISPPSTQRVLVKPSESISSSRSHELLEELKKSFLQVELTPAQVKTVITLQIFISLLFSIAGGGLLLRKEWARKYTLYFSFFM